MRNMSFSHTVNQIKASAKTETTRAGWGFLKPGDKVMAVEKAMGLKKGEKIKKIRPIEIVKVEAITARPHNYTQQNVNREGFPEYTPHQFVVNVLFHKCKLRHGQPVNRITFKYIEE